MFMIILGIPGALSAQVHFSEVTGSEEMEKMRQEASARQLLLFVDVYADWCAPCRVMDEQVYTDPDVATYMNDQFISIRLDGESEYGKQYASDHELQGYPSMFIFSPDGELISRIIGFTEADKLLVSLKNTTDNYSVVQQYQPKYESGRLKGRQFAHYIIATRKMGNQEQAERLASEYMQKMKDKKLSGHDIRVIAFYLTTDDPRWPLFSKDTERLREELGDDYMLAIEKTYNNTLVKAVEEGNIGLISSLSNELPPMVRGGETSSWDLRTLPYLQYYYYTDQIEELMRYVDDRFDADKKDDHRWLYGAAAQIIDMDQQYQTAALLEKAAEWFAACIALEEHFDYYFYLGMTYFFLEKEKESRTAFKNAESLVTNKEQQELIDQVLGFANSQ